MSGALFATDVCCKIPVYSCLTVNLNSSILIVSSPFNLAGISDAKSLKCCFWSYHSSSNKDTCHTKTGKAKPQPSMPTCSSKLFHSFFSIWKTQLKLCEVETQPFHHLSGLVLGYLRSQNCAILSKFGNGALGLQRTAWLVYYPRHVILM